MYEHLNINEEMVWNKNKVQLTFLGKPALDIEEYPTKPVTDQQLTSN